MVGVGMAWETTSTLIAGLAGILATYLTARYNSKNNFRILENERGYTAQQETLIEKKTAYVRMLQALEEMEFTLRALWIGGYGEKTLASSGLTEDLRALIARHLEVDLKIQNTERELELIAPPDVLQACRRGFYALREMGRILTEEGDFSAKPYENRLPKIVSLMRLDLGESSIGLPARAIEDIESDMMGVYALNAPESAIRLRLEAAERHGLDP